MPFYLSQAGGGGGNFFELDKMPVAAGDGGVMDTYQQYSFQSNFWNPFTAGSAGLAVVAKGGTGWHTLLNVTGKGHLYTVVAPAFGGLNGRAIVQITVDGTAHSYDYTLASTWNNGSNTRVRFLVGNGAFQNSPGNPPLFDLSNNNANSTGRMVSASPTLVSMYTNNIGIFVNPSAYSAHGFPSLTFDSSLNIQVYTSIHNTGDYGNYAGAVYTIRP